MMDAPVSSLHLSDDITVTLLTTSNLKIAAYRSDCDKSKTRNYITLSQASTKGEIHETLQICKSLTKRQIQCFNNVDCHGFEFATPYRALPSFVNNPLRKQQRWHFQKWWGRRVLFIKFTITL
jgi:hypothetical protein